MTEQNQIQLGKTLWAIADQLRGAMDADDFRDYMLSFLFLRQLPVQSGYLRVKRLTASVKLMTCCRKLSTCPLKC